MTEEQKNQTPPGDFNDVPLKTEAVYEHSKILDFVLGFVLAVALLFFGFSLTALFDSMFYAPGNFLELVLYIYLLYYFWVKKRKFITYGMLAIFLVPLFAFGACMMIFAGGGFMN